MIPARASLPLLGLALLLTGLMLGGGNLTPTLTQPSGDQATTSPGPAVGAQSTSTIATSSTNGCPEAYDYGSATPLGLQTVVNCAISAGFTGDDVIIFASIAYQESGFCPGAIEVGEWGYGSAGACDHTYSGGWASSANGGKCFDGVVSTYCAPAEGILELGGSNNLGVQDGIPGTWGSIGMPPHPGYGSDFPLAGYSPSSCKPLDTGLGYGSIYFDPACTFAWAHQYFVDYGFGFWITDVKNPSGGLAPYCQWAPFGYPGTAQYPCVGGGLNGPGNGHLLPWGAVCPNFACQATGGVGYDRNAAVALAEHFYDLTAPDGWFQEDSGPAYQGPATSLASAGLLGSGEDCTHFASAVIGSDYYGGYHGGGLNLSMAFTPGSLYGISLVPALWNYTTGHHLAANVTSFSSIQPGDLVVFDSAQYPSGAHMMEFLTAGSESTAILSGHSNSEGLSNGVTVQDAMTGGYFTSYHLLHILSASSSLSASFTVTDTTTGKSVPVGQATPSVISPWDKLQFRAVVAGGTPGYQYSWNFGQGSTSTIADPVFAYSVRGTFATQLTVKDAAGAIVRFSSSFAIHCSNNVHLNGCIVGMARTSTGGGYWLVGSDGGLFSFGNAHFYGSMGGKTLNSPMVGMAALPNSTGDWQVGADGGVFTFGHAQFYGSMAGKTLAKPIVGMGVTSDGKGYWLVGADGGVFSFGDAHFYGSMAGKTLAKPIVGMGVTSDGKGYWLVGADGGIFSFGDAHFYGSMAGKTLAKPVVGMGVTADGQGYWLVGADGGIFSFGDAHFYGSMGGKTLNAPITGMVVTPDGKGYWLVGGDGGIFSYGDARFLGSLG